MRTANLSGAEIAREVGISRQFVSRLRKGRAHGLQVERAEALERVLGCKPGRLFEYPGEAEQERAAS
jgi:DNA-binding Xre family transcriptional regulator